MCHLIIFRFISTVLVQIFGEGAHGILTSLDVDTLNRKHQLNRSIDKFNFEPFTNRLIRFSPIHPSYKPIEALCLLQGILNPLADTVNVLGAQIGGNNCTVNSTLQHP